MRSSIMRPSWSRSAARANGSSILPASPSRWSTNSSTPREGVTMKSTSSTVTLRSAIQVVVSVTNRANAEAPLTRPLTG
jgi:hypothetical protein